MKLKPYRKYKVSGVECLGDIPETWAVEPFKRQICRNDGGVWGDDPEVPGGRLTVVLRSTEQSSGGHWKIEDPAMRKLSDSEYQNALLLEGDLLVTKSSGSSAHIGKTTVVTSDIAALQCCYSNFMQRIRVSEKLVPKFAWYLMNNDVSRIQFDVLSNSTTGLANLNGTMIGQFMIAVPPKSDQLAITCVLDRETAKVDALIAKQEKLIELLKEKRQAVISHAVTKGLDPNVPMKPSGVEWLGDVPEHWVVKKLKHFVQFLDGRRIPLSGEERSSRQGEFPYYGASGIIDYIDEYLFDEDLILVSEDGANLINRATPISFIARGKYWVNNHAHILRPIDGINEYWAERIECEKLTPFVTGSAQPKLTIDALANLTVAAPPAAEERRHIAAFIRAALPPIDELIEKSQRAIALQKEHRTALISAAVTGRIDVRNEHAIKEAA